MRSWGSPLSCLLGNDELPSIRKIFPAIEPSWMLAYMLLIANLYLERSKILQNRKSSELTCFVGGSRKEVGGLFACFSLMH
jgi:hypothetical protein